MRLEGKKFRNVLHGREYHSQMCMVDACAGVRKESVSASIENIITCILGRI